LTPFRDRISIAGGGPRDQGPGGRTADRSAPRKRWPIFASRAPRVKGLVHSQLRKDENVYCECFKKEKYGETRHQERSWLDSALDVTTVPHCFDDEQDRGRHRSHEKQKYEHIKGCVRAIPSTKQVESAPEKEQAQYLG